MANDGEWTVGVSQWALATTNPLRRIVDNMRIQPNPEKELIRLSIGDPTIYGNLPPSERVNRAVVAEVERGTANGYFTSFGSEPARQAVAESHSSDTVQLSSNSVILASGCSGALDLAIKVLANIGDNIIIPSPGFSLYRCLTEAIQIECRQYRLLPENGWEADLEDMVAKIDGRTKAILVNNPSNPCGSVYTREHLEAIAEVARRFRIPIISDEVYAGMVFEGTSFFSMSDVAPDQPVLTCGGLAKRYLVPGWRLGWVYVHDRTHSMTPVRDGLRSLSTQILGPCSLVQAALPAIIHETPQEFFQTTIHHCEEAARLAHRLLSEVPALQPIMPRGAMYMMVGVKPELLQAIDDDIQFTQQLMGEASVFCLPGQCFEFPNFFRIVLSVPLPMLEEACGRMAEFCRLHRIATN